MLDVVAPKQLDCVTTYLLTYLGVEYCFERNAELSHTEIMFMS